MWLQKNLCECRVQIWELRSHFLVMEFMCLLRSTDALLQEGQQLNLQAF